MLVAERELGQLELRGELVAERLEGGDGGLVERRPGGRVGDDRAGRAVGESKRHDGGRAERTGRVAALDADPERGEQRPILCERLVDGANRLIAGGVMVGAGPDVREHALRVGDRDGAAAELLEHLVGDRPSSALGEPAPKLGQRRRQQFEHGRRTPRPAHARHGPDCARRTRRRGGGKV